MLTVDWTPSVHHDGSSRYVLPVKDSSSTVLLRLRTIAGAPIEKIFIRTSPDGEQHMEPMQKTSSDSICDWWGGTLHLHMLRNNYRFFLLSSEGSWWLTAAGMIRYTPTDATDFKLLQRYHAPA